MKWGTFAHSCPVPDCKPAPPKILMKGRQVLPSSQALFHPPIAMSERHPAYSPDHVAHSDVHWNRTSQNQAYLSSNTYAPSAYGSPPMHNHSYPYPPNPQQPTTGYPPVSRNASYPPPSVHSSLIQPASFPSQSGYMQTSNTSRPGYGHTANVSLVQGYTSMPPASNPYVPPQMMMANTGSPQVQYPASPQRPYACDMCALSFNRQHDLKRHRETHSGEKPFLCNGGCGKTFTRKDALKRHQVRAHRSSDDPCCSLFDPACEEMRF